MPCATSCCVFARGPGDGTGSSTGPDSNAHVTEKHYGCYKAGIFFALAIILLLLLGCLPVFLLTTNNNLILLILLVTFLLIGVATFIYFRWQRKRALAMRRTYEQQKFTLTRVHQATSSTTTATDPSKDSNGIKNDTTTTSYQPYGQHVAGKLNEPPPAGSTATMGKSDQGATKSPPRYSFI